MIVLFFITKWWRPHNQHGKVPAYYPSKVKLQVLEVYGQESSSLPLRIPGFHKNLFLVLVSKCVIKIRWVRAEFYVFIAFCFSAKHWWEEKSSCFPQWLLKPLWTSSHLAVAWVPGRNPQPLCALTGCSAGGDSEYMCVCFAYTCRLCYFIHMRVHVYFCV